MPWPSDGKTADGNSIAVLAVQIQWASPVNKKTATLRIRVAGFVRDQPGGWLWGGGVLTLYRFVLVERNQGEHFS